MIGKINNNILALGANTNLGKTQKTLAENLMRLSSGLKINSSKEDPTSLAISERFRSQITGYETANKNAMDANNLLQVADGAMNESSSILQRLRELSISAANGATSDEDRKYMQEEANQLMAELDNISGTTQYNGRKLLDGTMKNSNPVVNATAEVTTNPQVNVSSTQGASVTNLVEGVQVDTANNKDVTLQIKVVSGSTNGTLNAQIYASDQKDGNPIATINNIQNNQGSTNLAAYGYNVNIDLAQANAEDVGKVATVKLNSQQAANMTDNSTNFQVGANQGQSTGIGLGDMSTSGLRIKNLDFTTQAGAQNSLGMVDSAIQKLSTQRATVGSYQRRLDSIISSNESKIQNLSAAESRIRDADMAFEMMNLTRNQLLNQSGMAVLGQANLAPKQVMQLLG